MSDAASKPDPERTGGVRCVCGGTFGMGYNLGGQPAAWHSKPTCPAYDAIDSTADAVALSQRCRGAN